MRNFVACHNESEMGSDYDPLSVVTSKPVVKNTEGHIIWLIQGSGSKSPKSYFLSSRFVVETVEEYDGEDFKYRAQGRGVKFETHSIPLNDLPWFSKLKKFTGNFGLGLCEIKDPELIQSLEQLLSSHPHA